MNVFSIRQWAEDSIQPVSAYHSFLGGVLRNIILDIVSCMLCWVEWYNMEYWMIGSAVRTAQDTTAAGGGRKINRERERETTLTEMTVPSGSSSLFPFTWEDDTILERDRLGMSLNISICLTRPWVLTNILSLSLSGPATSVTTTLTDIRSYTYT